MRRSIATILAVTLVLAGALRAEPATPVPGGAATSGGQSPLPIFDPLGGAAGTPGGQSLLPIFDQPGGGTGDEFLDPEEAYVLGTEVVDANTIVARWKIADGYYLYRDKFAFTLEDPGAAALGTATFPPGKMKTDPYFGTMEVFYRAVEATIPVERAASGSARLTVNIRYQGCADAGLCYPPVTKRVAFELPPARAVAPASGAASASAGESAAGDVTGDELALPDRIARSLADGNVWILLASFFGFGLLLAFTPCVFPMVPILAGIIVGQGDGVTTRRAFTLSLVYVLAMASTYTAAGVLAGLFGGSLQAMFQDPWILAAFSGLFVLLALSMFGFYDIRIPAAWQARLIRISNRQQGGTYAGVAVMGLLSALIVGPSVAAPLAGALIYIGQTGDAVQGGLALLALSLGMGAPVLAAGTSAGKLRPRAGPWMNTVKAIFGVLLLAVAIYLLERIVPDWISLLLWAALLIVSAIYMGALDGLPAGAGGWRRLWKGAGLVLMVYGVLLMVGAASGGGDPFQPLRGAGPWASAAGRAGALAFEPVKGSSDLRAALRRAASEGKPVMLDYYADWCVPCKEIERRTFSDDGVRTALADVVLLRTDVTANDAEDRALLTRFGLFGPPAILFFGPDGRERRRFRLIGYVDAETFRAHVERATRT